ncbi:cuticle protein CP14.6-like isoform X1 [Amphibalanus amphitrite]|uniref:cuticle protein CP14.6-like isoform X1 n=1 Tax=Amphibalanus amphitrite TaxID=1232801 RepID=UPI001C8FAC1B|nr:cuticle protein CP14.6-like isoform X1 [Amphibalanus amphitrite]
MQVLPRSNLVFAAVLAVAAAAPSELPYERNIVEILRQNIDHNDDQSYQHSFESENGISVSESGQPEDDDSYSVSGQFSYTAPDGVTYTVLYSAGEQGFQAQGDHLPTPVPTEYPTPEVSEEEDEEEEEKEEEVRGEPQYERVIVGYRPRYN